MAAPPIVRALGFLDFSLPLQGAPPAREDQHLARVILEVLCFKPSSLRPKLQSIAAKGVVAVLEENDSPRPVTDQPPRRTIRLTILILALSLAALYLWVSVLASR